MFEKVFRVHGGEKIGSHEEVPKVGDRIGERYATPKIDMAHNIIKYNDDWAWVTYNDPYDKYQKVLVIKVLKYHIPEPDITHDLKTDQDQIIVDEGIVEEVLTVNEFIKKYVENK